MNISSKIGNHKGKFKQMNIKLVKQYKIRTKASNNITQPKMKLG